MRDLYRWSCKWWPGAIALVILWAFASWTSTEPVEGDIAARANAAVKDALLDKKRVTVAGRDVSFSAEAFSADGSRAVSGGNDRVVVIWELESGKQLRRCVGHANAVIRVAFSADGLQVFSASSQYEKIDKALRAWDAASGQELRSWGGLAADRLSCAAFAPDGQTALSSCSDVSVRSWKLTK